MKKALKITGAAVVALVVIGVVASSGSEDDAPVSNSAVEVLATDATEAPVETEARVTAPPATAAPATAPPATEPPTPKMTRSQSNAVGSAELYLDYSNFSRLGLIGQLEYEQFSTEDATFAVDYVDADWMAQAAGSAESYLEYSSFSCGSLTDQLEYEKFTPEQAAFGAQSTGIC